MSTTPSQETVEQTKQQIRTLINEIAELSRSDAASEDYFPAVLKRIVDALAAVGGAIWLLDDEGHLRLSYQINVNQNLLEANSEDAAKHSKLLSRLFMRGQSELVPPHSMLGEGQDEGNPSQYLLVVSPLSGGRQTTGLVEVFQRPNSAPNIQRGYMRFLDQMASLIGEWLKGHTLQKVSDRQLMWQQADHFARLVHDNLELRDTAFTVANEGRQLIGCDRVSVAIKKGRKCRVEATSGQDTIENRSNIITALNNLATRVVAAGESLWYDGSVEDLPPQLEEAIEDYVDLSHGRTIAILPIRRPEKVVEGDVQAKETVQREDLSSREIIGALIVEQIESQVPPDLLRSRCDLVYEHTARALNNSMTHSDLFLMPVWRALGRATWLFKGSAFPKTMTVLTLITIALLAMFLIRINHDLEAQGSLQPTLQRQVFAHTDGEVEEVKVVHGQEVKEGEELVLLRNRDLELQLTELEGQLEETRKQIVTSGELAAEAYAANERREAMRLKSQESEYRVRLEALNAQKALLLEKEKKLTLVSPIDGIVMTWDVEKTLRARPVSMGQMLLTIADPKGDYELELLMPEKRMKYLDMALDASEDQPLPVEFILATDPAINHKGTLSPEAIHARAELDESEGAIVKLRVQPDTMEGISRRPGAKVIADVTCGRRSAAFVWFHEVIEWVQANVIF
ncbi:MAG: HlyD family efflux transporter periplasmic adaptor subunit [Planctomycetales bacterium]|nr:HlyD family efflux transporter periplasmic adaptor subunit [Planctomycetales bacterium]